MKIIISTLKKRTSEKETKKWNLKTSFLFFLGLLKYFLKNNIKKGN